MPFDKNKIKSNFNRFSKNYDSLANLQKQVAHKLCEFAAPEIKKSQNILDLGCGTGFITQNITQNLNPKEFAAKNIFQLDIAYNMLAQNNAAPVAQNIFNINGDIENLPFKPNSFDLVLSSLAFQWINNLELTLKNIKEICQKSKSSLVFSVFVEDTLGELKKSAQQANINLAINDFISLNNLKTLITENFPNHQIELQNFSLEHENVLDLIASMKYIGASYSNKKSGDITLTKGNFSALNNFYLKSSKNCDTILSSWKVAYIKTFI